MKRKKENNIMLDYNKCKVPLKKERQGNILTNGISTQNSSVPGTSKSHIIDYIDLSECNTGDFSTYVTNDVLTNQTSELRPSFNTGVQSPSIVNIIDLTIYNNDECSTYSLNGECNKKSSKIGPSLHTSVQSSICTPSLKNCVIDNIDLTKYNSSESSTYITKEFYNQSSNIRPNIKDREAITLPPNECDNKVVLLESATHSGVQNIRRSLQTSNTILKTESPSIIHSEPPQQCSSHKNLSRVHQTPIYKETSQNQQVLLRNHEEASISQEPITNFIDNSPNRFSNLTKNNMCITNPLSDLENNNNVVIPFQSIEAKYPELSIVQDDTLIKQHNIDLTTNLQISPYSNKLIEKNVPISIASFSKVTNSNLAIQKSEAVTSVSSTSDITEHVSQALSDVNSTNNKSKMNSKICPICMDSLINLEIASTLCGHVFCTPCIRRALTCTKNRCPTCQKKLSGIGFHRLYLNDFFK